MVVSQFCSDAAVNSLFNYSKSVVDQLCNSYDRPKELRTMQYLIFAGMISYYGFEHIDVITEAYRKNQFIYTKDSLHDCLEKLGCVSKRTLDSLSDDTIAVFLNEHFYNSSNNTMFTEGKLVISDDMNYAPDELLEYVTHEVNHAVNSVKKDIVPFGKKYKTRKGLIISDYNSGEKRNVFMEEAVNTLQTEDIMDHILSFTEYKIEDPEIRYELDKLKYAVGMKHEHRGYPIISSIIKPLYYDGKLNYVLKERRIDGNVNFINSEFDAKAGTSSFDALSQCIDRIQLSDDDVKIASEAKAKSLIKSYVGR